MNRHATDAQIVLDITLVISFLPPNVISSDPSLRDRR